MHTADTRWTAILARDAAADGRFVYAVRSTGIFCHPSCPARRPRPDNVVCFPRPDQARAAGFRPCKRCRPETAPADARRADARLVTRACRLLALDQPPPSLSSLAGQLDTAPGRLNRTFRRLTGLTPRAYAAAGRAERARDRLAAGDRVTTALHEAGYNAPSRFYADAPRVLGMPPASYRDRGRGAVIRSTVAPSSLGAVLVAATENGGLCHVALGDDPALLVDELRRRFSRALLLPPDPAFGRTVEAVLALLDSPASGHDLPLDIAGTAFQRRVWHALARIPAGSTTTYGSLARRIGQPDAVRAVAGACAANPVAVVIPCHRVVGRTGALSGYRWGLDRKARLLARERATTGEPA